MQLKDWLGPAISAAGALVTIVFSVITRFEVRRQQRLQVFALRRQYDADLRTWANGTLTALADAVTLTFLPPLALDRKEFALRQEEVLSRLSAAADQGRWFFPNEDRGAHGSWKPLAYRGFRPAVLDKLVAAFYELRDVTFDGPNNESRTAIVENRRHFVSDIQVRLDPKTRDLELANLRD